MSDFRPATLPCHLLPRSVAARVSLHLLVLALGLLVVLPSPAAAAWFRRPAPASQAANARLAAEKERVPKPPPEPAPRTKPGTDQQASANEDTGNCLSDCLFGGLFGSSSTEPAPVAEPVAAMFAPPDVWRVGDAAVIPDVAGGALTLWSGAGGEVEGQGRVGELPAGAPIRVLETHGLVSGQWLRVALEDGSGPAGWVPESAIARPPPPPGPPPPPPRWPPDRPGGARPRTVLLASVGPAPLVGPTSVREEYTNPLFRVGLSGSRRIAPGLSLGASAGYGAASGNPQFDYVTPDRLDSPQNSWISVTDIGLRVGDFLPLRSGKTQWFWGLGPGAYWVYESADINYQVLQYPGPVVVASGTRTESLSRWSVGGEVVTGMLWWTGNRGGTDYLGLQLRGFLVAWSSEQKKSLTFDWIGDKTPIGVEIALTYAHDWF